MKAALLFAFFVFAAIIVKAQKVRFSDTSNHWRGFIWHEGTGYPVDYGFAPYISAYTGDTIISGMTYQRLVSGIGFTPALAIREDTVNERIFFRFIWPEMPGIDTLEHLFFDYNFKLNDTFRVSYSKGTTVHHVSAVGTVMLGGIPHRTWSMKADSGSWRFSYTFIEGL
jgi:hypothetical protein